MSIADIPTYLGVGLGAILLLLLAGFAYGSIGFRIACRRQEAAGPTPLDAALKALLNAYKEGDGHV